MRIEEVVGKRIKEVREARSLTQEEFGAKLADLLGKPWPRQTVSTAEKGQRSFAAAELLACSIVLGCDVAYLFRLPVDVDAVHTPAGVLTRKQIYEAERTGIPGGPQPNETAQEVLDEVEESLQKFGPNLRQIAGFTESMAQQVDLLNQYVAKMRQIATLEQQYARGDEE